MLKRSPVVGGLNLQQKVKDKVFYQALELLHDSDPKSMDKLNELIEENLKLRNSKPRTAPTAKTEKPSFLRSFSRDQPRNTLKNKPVAPAWTPTTKLISPSSLKTMRREPTQTTTTTTTTAIKQEVAEEVEEELEGSTEELEAGIQEEMKGEEQEDETERGKRKFGEMQGVKAESADPSKRAKLTKSDDGLGMQKRNQNINKKLKEVKKRREVRMSRFG